MVGSFAWGGRVDGKGKLVVDGLCDMAFEHNVKAGVVGVDVFGELGGGNDDVGRMQFGHEQDVARRLGPDERQQGRMLCLLVMRNYAIG